MSYQVGLGRRGVVVAFQPHHVEHLVPFCEIFGIPLLPLSEKALEAARWYPKITIMPIIDVSENRLQLFERMRQCDPQYEAVFCPTFYGRSFLKKERERLGWFPQVIFCPHGFSEKSKSPSHWRKWFGQQQIGLRYRPGRLGEGEAFIATVRSIIIGDLPRWYYETHRTYLDNKLDEVLGMSGDDSLTVLYTPTWNDPHGSSSVDQALETFIASAPSHVKLIVKPHPNLEDDLRVVDYMRQIVSSRANAVLLEKCPFTHPVLSRVDVLVTDMSAMAYAFLYYRRPIVLLNQLSGTSADCRQSRLADCSITMSRCDYDKLWEVIETQALSATAEQRDGMKRCYEFAFGTDYDGVAEMAAAVIDSLNKCELEAFKL